MGEIEGGRAVSCDGSWSFVRRGLREGCLGVWVDIVMPFPMPDVAENCVNSHPFFCFMSVVILLVIFFGLGLNSQFFFLFFYNEPEE